MSSTPADAGARRPRHSPAPRPQALQRQWFGAAPVLLLTAAVFLGTGGGWTLGAVALSLLAWLVLCWAALLQFRGTIARWGAIEWTVAAAPVLLLATQALPFPPWVFGDLPGRAAIQADLELAAAAGSWRPLTLDHSGTFRALAAMLPAVAMVVCLRGAPEAAVLKACRWLVGLACLSVLLGLLQVAGGPGSALRLHDFHNLTGALGFFAYRNHLAAFLLMVVPVAGALLLISSGQSGARASRAGKALLLVAVPLLLLGVALTLSRAGAVLGMITLLGCVLLAWRSRPAARRWRAVLTAAALVAGGLAVAAWLAAPTLLARFGESLLADGRWDLYAHVAEIARSYQPVGAGLGAFEQAFQAAPQNVVLLGAYMNHAHNEWLQLWLELGWLGAIMALIALAALVRAGWRVWRSAPGVGTRAGLVLARAATISLAVVAVHACFDYSLRSGANLVVFALLAALLLGEGVSRARGRQGPVGADARGDGHAPVSAAETAPPLRSSGS